MIYDPCTGACNDMYVRLNSTAYPPMQNGNASISGDFYLGRLLKVGSTSFINSTNIGVGVSTAAATLHIYDTFNNNNFIRLEDINGYSVDIRSGITYFNIRDAAGNTPFSIAKTDGTFAGNGLAITANGHVGIGSSGGSSLLEVYSESKADIDVIGNGDANNYAVLALSDTSTKSWKIEHRQNRANQFELEYYNGASYSTPFVITPGGNVGIGTTAPGAAKLNVSGNVSVFGTNAGVLFPDNTFQTTAAAGATSSGWTDDGTVVRLTTNTDNVGIGTTNPAEKLTVNGSNILHMASSPTFEGSIASSVYLDGAADVFVSGKYAYVTSWNKDTLAIFDVSTPSTPAYITNITFGAHLNGVTRVYVSGRYAYVLGYDADTLYVVDVSNPASPVLTGSFTNSTSLSGARSIYVSGRYAYVASDVTGSLTVIDVSNPAAPIQLSSLSDNTYLYNPRELYVSGRYAYVTSPGNPPNVVPTLAIIDISSPTSPTRISNYTNSSFDFFDVYVSGPYAYVLGSTTSTMLIVNVSNPAAPKFLGSISGISNPRKVRVLGRYAYVAALGGTLYVVDVSNPAAPTLAGSYSDATYLNGANGLYISGKYAYVPAYTADRLTVVDISGADLPTASIGGLAASTLDVSGNALVQNNLYVQNGLNVGIGGLYVDAGQGITTDGVLQVMASNQAVARIRSTSAGATDTGIEFTTPDRAWKVGSNIGAIGAGKFSIWDLTGAGSRVTIDTAGNVGINDNTPGAKLQVGGDLIVDTNVFFYPSNNGFIFNRTNLRVGIATVGTPQRTLDVNGDAQFASNVTVGGTDFHVDATNIRVGIGTALPAAALHIYQGGNNANLRIQDSDSTGITTIAGVEFGGTSAGVWTRTGYVGDGATATNDIYLSAESGNVLLLPSGNVGIKTSTPTQELEVVGDINTSFTVAATTNGVCHSGANTAVALAIGDRRVLVVCSGAPTDIAEWYDTTGTEPGDVVATTDRTITYDSPVVNARTGEILNTSDSLTVSVLERSGRAYQPNLLGVISTSPAQSYGRSIINVSQMPNPLAIAGRVPVKISTANGPIRPGDAITSSVLAGFGMKATEPGTIVGRALDSFDGSSGEPCKDDPRYKCGKIVVYISVGYWEPADHEGAQQKDIGQLLKENADLKARLERLERSQSAR
jgi:hypothetical protein